MSVFRAKEFKVQSMQTTIVGLADKALIAMDRGPYVPLPTSCQQASISARSRKRVAALFPERSLSSARAQGQASARFHGKSVL